MIPCPAGCDTDTRDGLLCKECTRRLRRDLEQIPGLVHDLAATYTRQTRTNIEPGRRTPDAVAPLPYDPRVHQVRADTLATLSNITTELAAPASVAANARARCHWLLDQIDRIRGHHAAPHICDAVWRLVKDLRHVVDRPPPRALYGKCPTCGHEVFGPADTETTTTPCRRCRAAGIEAIVHRIDRTERFWKDAPDRFVSRRDALTALGLINLPTPSSTFSSWVDRGELARYHLPDNPDRIVYRFGDVLSLATLRRKVGRPTRGSAHKLAPSG